MRRSYDFFSNIFILLLLVILPLAGLYVADIPFQKYLEFPPRTRYVAHAEFSWGVFIALAIFVLAVFAPLCFKVLISKPNSTPKIQKGFFPWWGWLGAAILGISWFMAWTRFQWFAPLQIFTFTPIWVGYIFVTNGLTYRQTGRCMLRNQPGYLFSLFVLSAFFWWYFEYLNRFVQNWHYIGIGDLSRIKYFLFATLPFSTVLPAVLSTQEFLSTMPRISAGLDRFIKIDPTHARVWALVTLCVFSIGLTVIGIWPDYLFPLVWITPLFMVTAFQAIRGKRALFSGVTTGDWQRLYRLSMSALICGFFWELWNYHSYAKWIYTIPFVERYKIFEMPLLGYAGYLPFGPTCALVADTFLKRKTDEIR